ncbi:hypothetical protein [Tabrizicola sp.]|uniref:hypothetical protein n=1 Tax=Tabrizicola sp. TaxID=2005166 RepID=UPI00260EE9C8|nr:hypothetical protein [Tabrizicola sp.]MDM7930449.1 hypothetical protein [Tabrizicola sp.]
MSEFWFKPKTHGYGAAPRNWKGWAAILLVILVSLALVGWLLLLPLASGNVPSLGRILLFLVLDVALIIAFIVIARKKTDGDWRWRWGGK